MALLQHRPSPSCASEQRVRHSTSSVHGSSRTASSRSNAGSKNFRWSTSSKQSSAVGSSTFLLLVVFLSVLAILFMRDSQNSNSDAFTLMVISSDSSRGAAATLLNGGHRALTLKSKQVRSKIEKEREQQESSPTNHGRGATSANASYSIFSESLVQGHNMRQCASPEYRTQHPMDGCSKPSGISQMTPTTSGTSTTVTATTCGFCSQTDMARHLQELSIQIQRATETTICRDKLVVYGAAFGEIHFLNFIWDDDKTKVTPTAVCHVVFVFEETLQKTAYKNKKPAIGLHMDENTLKHTHGRLLVGVNRSVLPYNNNRRNVKLFKMNPHLLFPWANNVIWMDAKLVVWFDDYRRGAFRKKLKTPLAKRFHQMMKRQVHEHKACGSMVSLPAWHESTMGPKPNHTGASTEKVSAGVGIKPERLASHCSTLINAFHARPTVSDSKKAVERQCRYYLSQAEQYTTGDTHELHAPPPASSLLSPWDAALIDSAILAWDLRTTRCRQFVANLLCTWLDEVHCFSDRDQVSFPHVLHQLNLVPQVQRSSCNDELLNRGKTGNQDWVYDDGDIVFVVDRSKSLLFPGNSNNEKDDGTSQPMLHFMNSQAHWYNGRAAMFQCSYKHGDD